MMILRPVPLCLAFQAANLFSHGFGFLLATHLKSNQELDYSSASLYLVLLPRLLGDLFLVFSLMRRCLGPSPVGDLRVPYY